MNQLKIQKSLTSDDLKKAKAKAINNSDFKQRVISFGNNRDLSSFKLDKREA